MKKISLSLNDFKKIIFESVYNILDNTLLLEYLVQRKDFVNLIWNLSDQIIENWCLVHYCTVIGQTEYKKHWADELKGYLKRISRTGIKSSNDFNSRKKCVLQAFAMNDLDKGGVSDRIYLIIQNKFESEGIDDIGLLTQISADCADRLHELIDILSTPNNEAMVNKYVLTI